MSFIPRNFVDVPESNWAHPPAGAPQFDAAFLNALQQAIVDQGNAIATLQATVAALGASTAGTGTGTGGGTTPTGGGGSGGGTATTSTTVSVSSVTTTSNSATVAWAPVPGTDGVTLSGVIVCRDGTDTTGTGPWCSTSDPVTGSRTFANLPASTIFNLTLQPLVNGQPYGPKVTTTATTAASSAAATTYVFDTFGGTVGAAWDSTKWVSSQTPATGGTVIAAGGIGKATTGSTGGYVAADAVARAFNMTSKADLEFLIDFQIVGEVYPVFFVRSSDNAEPAHLSYTVQYSTTGNNFVINYLNNYTTTVLATSSVSPAPNSWYTMRVRAVGSVISARCWLQGTVEPTAWNIGSVTTTAITGAGFAGFRLGAGGAAAGQVANFDNMIVTDGGSGVAPTPAPTPTTTGKFASGACLDGVDPVSPTAGPLYSWRGGTKPIGITNTYSDNSANTQINQWSMTYSQFVPYSWVGDLDLAFGGIFLNDGDDWATAAAGGYNNRWTQGLQNIVNNRGPKAPAVTYIRPWHEFNGDWYQWKVTPGNMAQFIAAWKQWYGVKQSIYPAAKVVWCPNRETSGGSGIKSTDAYPGSAYVDVIGVDYYLHYPPAFTQTDWNNQLSATDGYGGPKGIEAWRQFALAQGKPMCVPEWAVDSDTTGGAGGDQPTGMTNLLNYFEANQGTGAGQILYASLFNAATPTDAYQGKFGVYNGGVSAKQPQSAAAYQAWHQAR